MACHLFGIKQLFVPKFGIFCFELDSKESVSITLLSKFKDFHSRKFISKCHLPKSRPFCPGLHVLIKLACRNIFVLGSNYRHEPMVGKSILLRKKMTFPQKDVILLLKMIRLIHHNKHSKRFLIQSICYSNQHGSILDFYAPHNLNNNIIGKSGL